MLGHMSFRIPSICWGPTLIPLCQGALRLLHETPRFLLPVLSRCYENPNVQGMGAEQQQLNFLSYSYFPRTPRKFGNKTCPTAAQSLSIQRDVGTP